MKCLFALALLTFSLAAYAHDGGHDHGGHPSPAPVPGGEIIDNRATIGTLPAAPAPGEGMRKILPMRVIPANSHQMWCWYVNMNNDKPIYVDHTLPTQTIGGHHISSFLTFESQQQMPDGTLFDCTEHSSTMSRGYGFLLFPNSQNGGFQAPKGYGAVIPPHGRLVIQFHYHNPYDKPMLVEDVYDIYFPKEDETVKPMSTFIASAVGYSIPPHSRHSVQVECPVTQDLDVYLGAGHMHERGRGIQVELGKGGTYRDILRDDNIPTDDPNAALSSARTFFNPPLRLEAGNTVRVTCTWENREDKTLKFPDEMCAGFFFHLSGAQPQLCRNPAKVVNTEALP